MTERLTAKSGEVLKQAKMTTVDFIGYKCRIEFSQYQQGTAKLQLWDVLSHAPCATATVNIPGVHLEEDEVIIKNYAENAGMLSALVRAGVVAPTGRTVPVGGSQAKIYTLIKAS